MSGLDDLASQMTSNYYIVMTPQPPAVVRPALNSVKVHDDSRLTDFWLLRLTGSSDASLRYTYTSPGALRPYWQATVDVYNVSGGTFVVSKITNWMVKTESGMFTSTKHIQEPKAMEKFFQEVLDAIRQVDPNPEISWNHQLPASLQAIMNRGRVNPGPSDVPAGAAVNDAFAYAAAQANGSPVWDAWDGQHPDQIPLHRYGTLTKPPGGDKLVGDPPAFPDAKYVIKDLKGILFATASRLVIWFPYGRNGYMFGTQHADGYVRIGQCRYEWINEITFLDGTNNRNVGAIGNPARVAIDYAEPDGTAHEVVLVLDRNPPDARSVAQRLRQLVLGYRSSMTGPDGNGPAVANSSAADFTANGDPAKSSWSWHCEGSLPTGQGLQYRPVLQ